MTEPRLAKLREQLEKPFAYTGAAAFDLLAIAEEQAAELDQLRTVTRDDLCWLVGHLAGNCPDVGAVPLPPRLAPVVRECIETYQPGRFTLAVTLETTDD